VTEPVIAAAEAAAGPIVQAAVKALAPEAEQLLGELHDVAAGAVNRIEELAPELLAKAEHESVIALRTAQQHLAALLDHIAGALHIEQPEAAPVDPTAAPEAPTQS